MGRVLGVPGAAVRVVGSAAAVAAAVGRARVVRPVRPDRYARALGAFARWGQTVAAGYAVAAELYPDDAAIVDDAGVPTFAQVRERTNRLAAALEGRGIAMGDSVAVLCRNHRGFVESLVALSKLGADAVLLNKEMAAPQVEAVLRREGSRTVILDGEFSARLQPALVGRTCLIAREARPGDDDVATLEMLVAEGDPAARPTPARPGATTILTSGTTGAPKGVARSGQQLLAAVSILDAVPLRSRERVLIAPPLFHQWGFAHFSLGLLLSSTLVLSPRFDAGQTLATIERERVTCAVMVPVMLQRILELRSDRRRRWDTRSLRTVAVSGSVLHPDIAAAFMDEFGEVLYNLYGSTEVAWAAIARPSDLRRAPGTVGRPPWGTRVRIVDPDGRPVPAGGTGRILVGNQMVFGGYTAGGAAEVLDGLVATGDLGHLDADGRLFIDGRADDMIVSGGENVFSSEIEEALLKHPAVRDAAAVGVDDERFGQRVRAYVVAEGADEQALKEHVRATLARYKVPREIVFVEDLPRNPQGKLLKRELENR